MEWDLEHKETVGVEDRGYHPVRRGPGSLFSKVNKRVVLYAALALVPIILFGLMLVLARR
jgi:hypothetical protein